MKIITLDFGDFSLKAELFDTQVAEKFYNNLPYTINLTAWGQEVYGGIGIDLGSESPQPLIPSGGLAYTNQGNYFCVFFGQNPAWPVEYIGRILEDENFHRLAQAPNQVIVNPLKNS